MRLIDADALVQLLDEYDQQLMIGWVEDAPTIDAVPVVRCRECKRWGRLEFSPLHFCPDAHEFTDAEFFCKWGRRREDGEA